MCVDFNLINEDCFADGSKKYKTRRAVKLRQVEMRQNCAHSKKKLSRIILPDDSSEEENNVNDKRESNTVGNRSMVKKSKQQDHCLNLVPSGSSLQSKDHSNLIVNRLPKKRQQTTLNLQDKVSDVWDFKPQSSNKIECTSTSFTTVESKKDFPVQLKVWIKVEGKKPSYIYQKVFFYFVLFCFLLCFVLNNQVKEKLASDEINSSNKKTPH